VRAQIIASARQGGQARVVEAQPGSLRGISKAAPASPEAPPAAGDRAAAPAPAGEVVTRVGPYAPTEKQVAFYQRLAESPVFTEEERRRALEWLATKATRQTIKDQIDWLKRQVETRRANRGQSSAA
jgi:hypothetical protein